MKMLIDNAKTTTGFSAIALSGVLLGGGLLGMSGEASATASFGPPWAKASHVTDTVTETTPGSWTYAYTVHNDSHQDAAGTDTTPLIVDWELPYFSDAGITDITSPTGWNYAIETIGTANSATGWGGVAGWQDPADPSYATWAGTPYETATQVLHWYSECWALGGAQTFQSDGDGISSVCETSDQGAIFPFNSLGNFGFTANYDSTNGPYQASWFQLPIQTGDPQLPFQGIPGSPTVTGQQPSVPEPATLALFGLGLAGLGFSRRRRQK